jgi:hypothetical protein
VRALCNSTSFPSPGTHIIFCSLSFPPIFSHAQVETISFVSTNRELREKRGCFRPRRQVRSRIISREESAFVQKISQQKAPKPLCCKSFPLRQLFFQENIAYCTMAMREIEKISLCCCFVVQVLEIFVIAIWRTCLSGSGMHFVYLRAQRVGHGKYLCARTLIYNRSWMRERGENWIESSEGWLRALSVNYCYQQTEANWTAWSDARTQNALFSERKLIFGNIYYLLWRALEAHNANGMRVELDTHYKVYLIRRVHKDSWPNASPTKECN